VEILEGALMLLRIALAVPHRDGARICVRNDVPAVNREIGALRGFTRGMPDFGLAWFCPGPFG
jgi:hypothetical protein